MSSFSLQLEKTFTIALEKAGLDLDTIPKFAVKLAMDYSGSMYSLYPSWVESVIRRFIVAAMKFDDDGELEVGFFNTEFKHAPGAFESDINEGAGYLARVGYTHPTGGTRILEALETFLNEPVAKPNFIKKLFGKKDQIANQPFPAYITIITDGDAGDAERVCELLKTLERVHPNVFVQFISLGNYVDHRMLQRYDDCSPNVNWQHIDHIEDYDDSKFFELIANPEFTAYVEKLQARK